MRRAEHIPGVFTPRFLRVLVNSLGHPDAHLHAAAKRLTEQVSLPRGAPGAWLLSAWLEAGHPAYFACLKSWPPDPQGRYPF